MTDRNGERPGQDKTARSEASEKAAASTQPAAASAPARPGDPTPKEIGGPKGLEPTRYGDWEKGGRCSDF
jgi:hypothetical protein